MAEDNIPETPFVRPNKESAEAHAAEMRLRFVLELAIGVSARPADAISALSEAVITLCLALDVPLDGLVAYFEAVTEACRKMPESERERDRETATHVVEHCMQRAYAHRQRQQQRAKLATTDGAASTETSLDGAAPLRTTKDGDA